MPWADLDLFYANVRFDHLRLYMGKNENNLIFTKLIAAYDLKVGTCIDLNDLLDLHEYPRSRSFFDFPQRFHGFQSSILFFSLRNW